MGKTSAIRRVCIDLLFLYVVIFQVHNVSCQVLTAQDRNLMPFCIRLPGTLQTSQVIKITGKIFQSPASGKMPTPWLNVVLNSGCSSSRSQFFLRMQVENGVNITGNSFEDGHWGEEKSGKTFTFPPTGQFVLLIAIQSDGYKVTGNGIPLWTLPHRMPYSDVARMTVRGASADISKIELIDQADPDQERNTQMFYPVPLEEPIVNPTFPFWGFFPGGLQVGKVIRIKGYFPHEIPGTMRTFIDLCKERVTGPIMLHTDIRFKLREDTRRVVRNYYRAGRWNPVEERDGPFPFDIGEKFTMDIQVQPNYYNISVNGVPCWTYYHRMPFTEVNQLVIGGNTMNILEVAYTDTSEKKSSSDGLSASNSAMGSIVHLTQAYHTGISISLLALMKYFLQMM